MHKNKLRRRQKCVKGASASVGFKLHKGKNMIFKCNRENTIGSMKNHHALAESFGSWVTGCRTVQRSTSRSTTINSDQLILGHVRLHAAVVLFYPLHLLLLIHFYSNVVCVVPSSKGIIVLGLDERIIHVSY